MDDRWLAAWRKYREAALAALERKAAAPLEQVTAPELDETRREFEKTLSALPAYNDVVEKINASIQVCKDNASLDELATAQREPARLELVRKRYEGEIDQRCKTYKSRTEEKKEMEKLKDGHHRQRLLISADLMKNYKIMANNLLKRFGANFSIAEMKRENPAGRPVSTWAIEIRRRAVPLGTEKTAPTEPQFKNTSSAGDRSALAFAFFIAQLEKREDLARRIVFVDDPFTSQDASRKETTLEILGDLAEKFEQMVVSSHDPFFLWNIWKK